MDTATATEATSTANGNKTPDQPVEPTEPTPTEQSKPESDAQVDAKPVTQTDAQTETKADAKTDAKADAEADAEVSASPVDEKPVEEEPVHIPGPPPNDVVAAFMRAAQEPRPIVLTSVGQVEELVALGSDGGLAVIVGLLSHMDYVHNSELANVAAWAHRANFCLQPGEVPLVVAYLLCEDEPLPDSTVMPRLTQIFEKLSPVPLKEGPGIDLGTTLLDTKPRFMDEVWVGAGAGSRWRVVHFTFQPPGQKGFFPLTTPETMASALVAVQADVVKPVPLTEFTEGYITDCKVLETLREPAMPLFSKLVQSSGGWSARTAAQTRKLEAMDIPAVLRGKLGPQCQLVLSVAVDKEGCLVQAALPLVPGLMLSWKNLMVAAIAAVRSNPALAAVTRFMPHRALGVNHIPSTCALDLVTGVAYKYGDVAFAIQTVLHRLGQPPLSFTGSDVLPGQGDEDDDGDGADEGADGADGTNGGKRRHKAGRHKAKGDGTRAASLKGLQPLPLEPMSPIPYHDPASTHSPDWNDLEPLELEPMEPLDPLDPLEPLELEPLDASLDESFNESFDQSLGGGDSVDEDEDAFDGVHVAGGARRRRGGKGKAKHPKDPLAPWEPRGLGYWVRRGAAGCAPSRLADAANAVWEAVNGGVTVQGSRHTPLTLDVLPFSLGPLSRVVLRSNRPAEQWTVSTATTSRPMTLSCVRARILMDVVDRHGKQELGPTRDLRNRVAYMLSRGMATNPFRYMGLQSADTLRDMRFLATLMADDNDCVCAFGLDGVDAVKGKAAMPDTQTKYVPGPVVSAIGAAGVVAAPSPATAPAPVPGSALPEEERMVHAGARVTCNTVSTTSRFPAIYIRGIKLQFDSTAFTFDPVPLGSVLCSLYFFVTRFLYDLLDKSPLMRLPGDSEVLCILGGPGLTPVDVLMALCPPQLFLTGVWLQMCKLALAVKGKEDMLLKGRALHTQFTNELVCPPTNSYVLALAHSVNHLNGMTIKEFVEGGSAHVWKADERTSREEKELQKKWGNVIVFGRMDCPHTVRALKAINDCRTRIHVNYKATFVHVDDAPKGWERARIMVGCDSGTHATLPLVFCDHKFLGGADQVEAGVANDGFQAFLAAPPPKPKADPKPDPQSDPQSDPQPEPRSDSDAHPEPQTAGAPQAPIAGKLTTASGVELLFA